MSKSNNKSNGFLISENQNPEIQRRPDGPAHLGLYVSLDNADTVIEGAPSFLAFLARAGLLEALP